MFSKNLVRFYLFFFVLNFAISIASAQENPEVKWQNGKKYIVHKIQKGETWSGIAVKYKATIKDLQSINPKAKELKFDQAILIPFDNYLKSKKVSSDSKIEKVNSVDNSHFSTNKSSISDSLNSTNKKDQGNSQIQPKKSSLQIDISNSDKKNDFKVNPNFISYKVQSGETLYRIAKNYKMHYDDLAKFNGLKSTNVQAGQIIKIPLKKDVLINEEPEQVKTNDVNDSINSVRPNSNTNPYLNPNSSPSIIKNDTARPNSYSFQENNGTVNEQGVATWLMEGPVGKKEKFYALHRTAPIGTIIKVNNPMSNRSVYVKVVGVLPDTGDNHDVLIKITQSAARRIGIFESRFRVEITYKSK